MQRKSLDGNLTKKAYSKSKYSEENLLELKKSADKKTGYLYFMKNFMWIQHPTKGRMKFNPYPFQEKLLETITIIDLLSPCVRGKQVKQHVRPDFYYGMQCLIQMF